MDCSLPGSSAHGTPQARILEWVATPRGSSRPRNQSWVSYIAGRFFTANSAAPWTAVCQASLFSTISQSLLKFMSIELVMLSNHLILHHPLLFLPSIFPSIRVFSNDSALCIRWPEDWRFSSASVLPMNIQG